MMVCDWIGMCDWKSESLSGKESPPASTHSPPHHNLSLGPGGLPGSPQGGREGGQLDTGQSPPRSKPR